MLKPEYGTVFLSVDETEELAKLAAEGIVKYVREHSTATDAVIADMIQGTLDGFIIGKLAAIKSDKTKN